MLMKVAAAEIIEGGRAAEVIWTDGHSARFHAIWLRDNALDPQTRSVTNGQRLITVLDIEPSTAIGSASATANGDLRITFTPEGVEAVFPAEWLHERIYDKSSTAGRGWVSSEIVLWDSALDRRVPSGSYPQISQNRAALGIWLTAVRRYGVALLRDIPPASGSLCDVAKLFGHVRETNYGRWFEVRAEVDPTNLAYTNLGLQAHTDNPYRDPVPTLQLLSCLENSVEGGESVVVDGFMVAERLRRENPRSFDLSTATRPASNMPVRPACACAPSAPSSSSARTAR